MPRPGLPIPLVSHEMPVGLVPRGLPLPELWRRYLSSVQALQLSPSRQSQLRRSRDLSVSLPEFPERHHVVQWLTNMSSNRAGTTVRLHKWDLQALYSWAHANGLAGYNPLHRLAWKVAESERLAIRDIYEKWPAILDCAQTEREAAFLGVMRFCGLRPAEAQGLFGSCVETWREPWTLHVRQQRVDSSLEISQRLKTKESFRALEVRPELRALLAPVLAMPRAVLRVGLGGGAQLETELLFPLRTAEILGLISRMRAALPEDFPPGHGLHVLRHSFAVEKYRWDCARAGGCDVVQLSKLLGHASIKYTQTYLRGLVGDDVVRGAFDGMEGPPPWASSNRVPNREAVTVPSLRANFRAGAASIQRELARVNIQSALKLGPLGAVPSQSSKGVLEPPKKREAPTRVRAAKVPQADSSTSDSGNPKRRSISSTRKAV